MYPAQSVTVEYTALFTKHLIYADISKTCFGRERGVCFTSRYCQHILHKKHVCNRFVHNFQKLKEYKIKGHNGHNGHTHTHFFSPQLSCECVKDCSGTTVN